MVDRTPYAIDYYLLISMIYLLRAEKEQQRTKMRVDICFRRVPHETKFRGNFNLYGGR